MFSFRAARVPNPRFGPHGQGGTDVAKGRGSMPDEARSGRVDRRRLRVCPQYGVISTAKAAATKAKSLASRVVGWAQTGIKFIVKAVKWVIVKIVNKLWGGSPPETVQKVTAGVEKVRGVIANVRAGVGKIGAKISEFTKYLSPLKILLEKVLDAFHLKLSGILLPVIDWLAAQVAGLIVPLILEVVTVEVGGLGSVSSILTALVHNIVLKLLIELYNDIVWPFVFEKPITLIVEKVGDLLKKGVRAALNLIEKTVVSGAKAVTGIIRDKIMGAVPLPGVIVKVLEMINRLVVRIGGDHVAKLKRQADLVQGLLMDLAKKKGKVCGVKLANVPEPPRLGFFDLQTKLMQFVFNKLTGRKR